MCTSLWDGQRVAGENIGVQLHGPGWLGRPKVESTQDIVQQLSGDNIDIHPCFVTGGELFSGIVIDAIDNMGPDDEAGDPLSAAGVHSAEAEQAVDPGLFGRRQIWSRAILPRADVIDAYVSVRMGAQVVTIFTVRPAAQEDVFFYEDEALFGNEQALPPACHGSALADTVAIGAGLTVRLVRRLLTGQKVERRIDFDTEFMDLRITE